jgi:hypothetical protein
LCCGYDPKNDQTPTVTVGKYSFNGYSQQDDGKGACVLKDSHSYEDKNACTTALSRWTSLAKTTYAVASNCDGTNSSVIPTPTASWDKLSALRTCEE